MANPLRVSAWLAVALLVLGQMLSWNYGERPAGEVWDWLFSRVSKPNIEWWIWFLAPTIAAFLAARDLVPRQSVSSAVLIPIAVFLMTWVVLFPLGHRRYTGFRQPGFLLTFAGLLLLGAVAAMSMSSRRTARPSGPPNRVARRRP